MAVKIYSLRNKEFGAFEYIVPARAGVAVKLNQEVELENPRLHSVGRVNSSQTTNSSGRQETNYVGFVERSIIKMNGINFDSEVKLSSRGEVTSIYQPIEGEKNQYVILLNCQQNGSEIRVLLLVKVTGNKVSEMAKRGCSFYLGSKVGRVPCWIVEEMLGFEFETGKEKTVQHG